MRCIATDPSFCRGHHALGLLMYGTGDFMQAQSYFKACVALAQKEDADAAVGALHYAGLCWSALGVFEKAEEYFVRALARDAEHRLLVRAAAGDVLRRGAGRRDGRCGEVRTRAERCLPTSSACSRRATASATRSRSLPRRRRVSLGRPGRRRCHSLTKAYKTLRPRPKVGRRFVQFEGLVQLEDCPGFLPNTRHHRMFGLMVLHAAHVAKQAFAGNAVNWREVYEVGTRWRREAEPGDAVWWIDGLPEKAFAEGFGLHTPMQSGQLRVVRYAKYIPRCAGGRQGDAGDGTCHPAKMISWSGSMKLLH